MKRFFACLLLFALLLSLAACGGTEPPATKPIDTRPPETTLPQQTKPAETEPVVQSVEPLTVLIGNHYLDEWTEDYIQLAAVDWNSVILSEEDAALYPHLAAALEQWNNDEWDMAYENLEFMLPDARNAAAEMGMEFNGYTNSTCCTVQRADNRILSIRCNYDIYTGGGAPYYGTICLNLDPATGEKVYIDSVVTDVGKLPQLIEDALIERYPDIPSDVFGNTSEYLESFSPEAYTWTLGYQGVTFYFGVSEIGARALGALSATLWFDENPAFFAEAYTELPEKGYAMPLTQHVDNELDLHPGDDLRDLLYVSISELGELDIVLNGNTLRNKDFFAYYMDTYLVTLDGERFYLCVDSASDNDYRTMYVYDLSGEEPVCVTELSGDGFRGHWREDYRDGTWFIDVFNDPSSFTLATRVNLLGTMTGIRPYHISPAGIPQAESEYYTLEEAVTPLVSKIPLEVLILPEQQTETIPAGTQFRFLRTNNDSYVDMLLEDGRECRILVTYSDWQPMVNGLPETDCFDGIQYVG